MASMHEATSPGRHTSYTANRDSWCQGHGSGSAMYRRNRLGGANAWSPLPPIVDDTSVLTRRPIHLPRYRYHDTAPHCWPAPPFELLNANNLQSPSQAFDDTHLLFPSDDQALMFQSHPPLHSSLDFMHPDINVPAEAVPSYSGDLLDDLSLPFDNLPSRMKLPENAGEVIADVLNQQSKARTHLYRAGLSSDASGSLSPVPSNPQSSELDSILPFSASDPLGSTDILAGHSKQRSQPETNIDALIARPERTRKTSRSPLKPQTSPRSATVSQESMKTQERPYECSRCGLRFRKRCNLINHEKIVRKCQLMCLLLTCALCSSPQTEKLTYQSCPCPFFPSQNPVR
jgi:hypothetical protein